MRAASREQIEFRACCWNDLLPDDAWRTEHRRAGIPFKVAQLESPLDDFGPVMNASAQAGFSGLFSAAAAFAAVPQKRPPMQAMLVPLDPGVDRLGRDTALRRIGMFLLEPTRDLLRSPLLGQASANGFIELGIVHLAGQRTLPPPPLRMPTAANTSASRR